MKKLIVGMLVLMVSLSSANAEKPLKKNSEAVSKVEKVEVYYFHFSRRCVTCQAVEAESKKDLAVLYPALFKSGKVTFKSVNLDESDSKSIAKKCNAEGQSLLILSGKKRFDLTDQGFMYARSNPEKFKQELKKTIDPLIK